MEPPTPNPEGVPPTNLQHSYTKGTPHSYPPAPNAQGVPPTNLHHSYTKGTPYPTPTPNLQGVPPTNLQHSYTEGTPHPLPPTHRKYHPSTYNTYALKGPPTLHPYPQPTGTNTHQLTTHTH